MGLWSSDPRQQRFNQHFMSKLLPQQYTPMEIEALAASSALEFAAELGFNREILETNSQVLSNALRNNSTYFLWSIRVCLDTTYFAELKTENTVVK